MFSGIAMIEDAGTDQACFQRALGYRQSCSCLCISCSHGVHALQASTNPLRVMVHHLRDEKYTATDDVIKVRTGPLPDEAPHICLPLASTHRVTP